MIKKSIDAFLSIEGFFNPEMLAEGLMVKWE
jgi:hypothetical protein